MQLGRTVVRAARAAADGVFTGRHASPDLGFGEDLPVVVGQADVGVQPVGELGAQSQLGDKRLFVAADIFVVHLRDAAIDVAQRGRPVGRVGFGIDIVVLIPFDIGVPVGRITDDHRRYGRPRTADRRVRIFGRRVRVLEVQVGREHVVDLAVGGEVDRVAGEAVVRHITVAVHVTVRETESGFLGTARQCYRNIIVLAVLIERFPVVRISYVAVQRVVDAVRFVILVVLIHFLSLHRREGGTPRAGRITGRGGVGTRNQIAFVTVAVGTHPVFVLERIGVLVDRSPFVRVVHFDADAFTGFTLFGGDHDGAVGSAGTVQRSGGGAFQYRYRFVVVRVQVLQLVAVHGGIGIPEQVSGRLLFVFHHDTVDHVDRGVVLGQRLVTTDRYGRSGGDTTRTAGRNTYPGYFPLKGVGRAYRIRAGQLISLYRGGGITQSTVLFAASQSSYRDRLCL